MKIILFLVFSVCLFVNSVYAESPNTHAVSEVALASGLVARTTNTVIDYEQDIFYRDITIKNTTGRLIPEDSQLIFYYSSSPLANSDGLTQYSRAPYLLFRKGLANNDVLTIRAEFKFKEEPSLEKQVNFSLGFKVGRESNGKVFIKGLPVAAKKLTAVVNDVDGISERISYQWFANGRAIEGAIWSIYTPTLADLGANITVNASYTDFSGFNEQIASVATSRIVSKIVNGESDLRAALDSAVSGDWLGLSSGDYDGMAEISIGKGITLSGTESSDAIISGETCIVLDGDKSAMIGLTFSSIDILTGSSCDANGDGSVFLKGDSVVLSHNQFNGEVEKPSSSTYNWVTVRGSYSLIERNQFTGKNFDRKGAVISIYNNASIGDQYGHIVQYNLFENFTGGSQGTTAAVQLGRSSDASANGAGAHIVRFNRFSDIKSKQRLLRVQSSKNAIYGNTIEDSLGNIALENGAENIVANNIILPTGEDSDRNDGGISFTPYGHTIANNYIAGVRSTSSQRGGLVLNSEELSDSSNLALDPTPVRVLNNTIINSRQAINMSSKGCVNDIFIVEFDSNLIANGENPTVDSGEDYGFEGRFANGAKRDAVIDNCSLNNQTSHNREHYYSARLSKKGNFSFSVLGVDNIFGGEGGADLRPGKDGLFEGRNSDENIGADTTQLVYLKDEHVGPGSTFVAVKPQTQYSEVVSIAEPELRTWNITLPSGEVKKDPQWLIDRNTIENVLYYNDDGSMVFRTPNYGGTTANSSFSRTELREMLRGPDADYVGRTKPKVRGFTPNNWVFSTANFSEIQPLMGGVDGVLNATLRVDHVSSTGSSSKVGRVIVGQIHASDDEPIRLYYRKLPNNKLGSIYFAHEVPGVGDTIYNLIGTSASQSANPIDGIALGEIWEYEIRAIASQLTVTIRRQGKPDVVQTVDAAPAYYNDWMYFKAGVYNQNNTGDLNDYAQATFFSLTKSHGQPVNNEVILDNDGPIDIIDGASLQNAIDRAEPNAVLELGAGNYKDIGTIVISVPGITLKVADGVDASISGATCIQVRADNVTLTGLVFKDIASVSGSPCMAGGDGALSIEGDNIVFSHNLIDGDALRPLSTDGNTFNWLLIRGSNALIERNTFQNKQGLALDGAQLRGSFISVLITGRGQNNVIQYNLFKDMLLNSQSLAYAIGLGRSTGSSAWKKGNNTIQFNRFDNIDSKNRVIRVQGSSNNISGNTFVNSQGLIALEDGQKNNVSNNVILPSGKDSNDGGINFAPYGHTITNNYIAGLKTSSSERGGLVANWSATGSGNSNPSNLPSPVIVMRNTILNAKQAILFAGKKCGSENFVAEFSQNLVVNGVDNVSEKTEGKLQTGFPAVRDDCELDASSTFDFESYFTGVLSKSGRLTLNGSNNKIESEINTLIRAAENGFIEDASSVEKRPGADVSLLHLIEEFEVGVGSTTAFQ